ncbi:MAG: hypothetical protein WCR41_09940, partial [Bacteroidales bacterium]
RNKLALATMWKKKAPSTQQHTSETSRPRKSLLESVEGASTSIIASPEEEVKLEKITEAPKKRKAPMRATRGTSALQGASQKAESSATSIIASTGQEVKSAETIEKVTQEKPNITLQTKSNITDVGSLDKETAGKIGRESAPIRVTSRLIPHLPKNRIEKIKEMGYSSVEHFVSDVLQNYRYIHKGKGESLLVSKDAPDRSLAFIELKKAPGDKFYEVESIMPKVRDNYLKNKEMLLDRAQTSQSFNETPPSAVSGRSISTSIIASTRQEVKSADALSDAELKNTTKIEKPAKDGKLYSVEYLVAKYAAQGLKQAAKVVRRGAALIHSGVKEFAKWARQLVSEFGQNVKKYLVGLYKDVTTAYNRQKLHRRRGAIDLRPVGKTRQQIIELPVNLPDGLKTDSISAIRSWLKENFQGKSIFNKSLNAEIEFVAKGIKETVIQLAHRKNKEGKIEAHKHSLPILDKLLEQAIYENSTDDKNKGLKKDFADKIHYLSTNVRFEGEDYHIKFVVKQYGAKNNYHTHMLSNIEIKKESYAQKDGLRDYLTASAPLSDSFTSSIPKTETEVKPSEIDEIKAQAKADGTWLKAPNGKALSLMNGNGYRLEQKRLKIGLAIGRMT